MAERRRRTPPQKKADEYDRDHHRPHAHGVWRAWQKVKAHDHRRVRRKAAQLERDAAALAATDPEAFEAAERRTVVSRIRAASKVGSTPSVRERVRSQREARVWKAGWDRYFKRPYDRDRHREPACRFLDALANGRSGEAVQLARHFRAVLVAPRSGRGSQGVRGTTARWLDALFADEPAAGARFRRWVDKTAGPPGGGARGA